MVDNKRKVGSPDNKRIDVHEEYEVRDWAKSLGVTPTQVKNAVDKVGTSAEKVKQYLKSK